MTILIALLVIVAVFWLWKSDRLSETSREQVASRVTQTTSKVAATTKDTARRAGERLSPVLSHVLSQVEGRVEGKVRLPFRRHPDLDKQFMEWMGQAELERRTVLYKSLPADAAESAAWLQGLADQDLGDFVQELSAFCKGRGFELDWLADPKVTGEMKRAVEETVGLYCLAVWKGRDVRPFAAYRAWLADPVKKENQSFAQRLYSRLIAAGFAAPSPDLWWAPEQERQAHVAKAMESAAAQDPKVFVSLLRDAADASSAVEVEAEPPAKGAEQTPPAEATAPAAVVAAS
jgi:hypothetical protein